MFHLAPTGLPSPSKIKAQRGQQNQIEKAIINAIKDFLNTNTSFENGMVYSLTHPNTIALVKSLDKFFSHGLIKMDKCYWPFVQEFIPSEERVDLKTKWNCFNRRELSLAWLKDSLNRQNLQFQMFAFIACGEEVKKQHYERSACMRNMILLKRVCLQLDDIATLKFNIEPPYIFRTEDTPIALPVMDGTMSPIQSSNSSMIGIQFTPNLPMIIHKKRGRESRPSLGCVNSVGSYSEIARNSYLDGLVHDLPEVDLSELANADPIVQSAKEQSYILDDMLKTKRKGIANSTGQFFIEEEEEERTTTNERATTSKDAQSSESDRSLIPEDPCTSSEQLGQLLITENSQTTRHKPHEGAEQLKEEKKTPGSIASSNSLLDKRSSSMQDDDELSALDENDVLMEGEIFLDSGEIIQLQLELCVKDGERIQRLFQVYNGHAMGQPLIRYLLLTDQFIYLLTGIGHTNEEEANKPVDLSVSPSSALVEELAAEAFERNLVRMNNGEPPKKFKILIVLPLCDLDHLTVGVDANVLCFHSKRKKFRHHSQSGHEQRTFIVETCSKMLGKTIAFALQRIMASRTQTGLSKSSSNKEEDAHQTVTPLSITTSHSSQLAIMIKRFLRRELGIQQPEIVHLSLVYWQQNAPRHQLEKVDSSVALECYLYVREIYQRGWTGRKGIGDWQQSYVVLRGLMLYQFSDSSFKFAQRSMNLRDSVEGVYHLDLKNDEKYTFQLKFSKPNEDGLQALQFSCPNSEVMNKWIGNLSLALSISSENPPPAACMAVLTEAHMLFAQEGMNCLVDGFMRSLGQFHIHESAEIFAVRTDFNMALVIRRDNGLDEWIVFREQSELDRMVECLRGRWKLPVIECGGEGAEQLLDSKNNPLYMECAQMPILWRMIPKDSSGE